MENNAVIISNTDDENEKLIAELHENDQLFNSAAIRFECFRGIFLDHFNEYLIKRTRANKRGLTKVIIGLRAADKVVIYNRNTDKAIKENLRAEIELFMTHMTNIVLKMKESGDEPDTLRLCEHNLVILVNKFVYHEALRDDLLKKAKEIKKQYLTVARGISNTVYQYTERKIPGIGKSIFMDEDVFIEDLTGVDALIIKEHVMNTKRRELTELVDLLELGSVEELISIWSRVNTMVDQYETFVAKRNSFVDTITPLVRKMCSKSLNRPQYQHQRRELSDILVNSCVHKLLANIFMYIPDNRYTTFAFPHIKQEIKKELEQLGMVVLPAKYRLLQGPVIEAGKHPTRVWCEMQALETMKKQHPDTPWSIEIIQHCRYGNIISESIHADDDDEQSYEMNLTSGNNPENELRNEELHGKLMEYLSQLPKSERDGLMEFFSNSSDRITSSKFNLVSDDSAQGLSPYKIKKCIQELRVKFNHDLGDLRDIEY